MVETIEKLSDFIGKTAIVFHTTPAGNFKYEGKVLDIDTTFILILDAKEGAISLPISACKIKECRNE